MVARSEVDANWKSFQLIAGAPTLWGRGSGPAMDDGREKSVSTIEGYMYAISGS
jgi:hypothetical protein